MTVQGQGFLSMIAGCSGLLMAFCYASLAERFSLTARLGGSLAFVALITLGFLFYHSVPVAVTMSALAGLGGAAAEISLFDLAIRATPPGSEALGFALMVSVRNLVAFGSDWVGSALLDGRIASFDQLIWIDAVTTAICVPVLFLLPKALLRLGEAPLERGSAA
jgi:predicted MFS family arabinose efflux permease